MGKRSPTPPPSPPLVYMSDDEYARMLVWTLLRNRGGQDKVKSICRVVAEHFGVAPERLLTKCRQTELVGPRYIVMYVVVHGLRYSRSQTARAMGGRHHTTVLDACRTVAARMQDDADFAMLVGGFMRECELNAIQDL